VTFSLQVIVDVIRFFELGVLRLLFCYVISVF